MAEFEGVEQVRSPGAPGWQNAARGRGPLCRLRVQNARELEFAGKRAARGENPGADLLLSDRSRSLYQRRKRLNARTEPPPGW